MCEIQCQTDIIQLESSGNETDGIYFMPIKILQLTVTSLFLSSLEIHSYILHCCLPFGQYNNFTLERNVTLRNLFAPKQSPTMIHEGNLTLSVVSQ